MKFAVALLVACFVCTSYQVQPRAHYIPLYYADGMPAGYDIVDWNKAAQVRNTNAPVKRLLGNLLPSIAPPITVTVTSTSVMPSTITTATVVNCLPSSLFAATTATTLCGTRRRRGIEESVEASVVQPVEASALPEPIASDNAQATSEILSSMSEEEASLTPKLVLPRAGNLATTKTVVLTSYSITFVPTTITSTRAIATASALMCRPVGYVVCA